MSLRRGIERRAARGKDATGQLLGGGNEMQKESDEIEVRGEPVAEEEKGWKEERTTRSGSDGSAWHGRHAAPRLLRATATGARLPRWPQRGPPAKIVLPGAMRCKLLLYRCGRPCSCERPRGVRGQDGGREGGASTRPPRRSARRGGERGAARRQSTVCVARCSHAVRRNRGR
jgi:hypothetical protein